MGRKLSYLQFLIDDTGKIVDLTIDKITLLLDGLSKVVENLVDLCSMLFGAVSLITHEEFAEKFILFCQLVNLFILREYHHTRILKFFSNLLHLIPHRSQIIAHVCLLFLEVTLVFLVDLELLLGFIHTLLHSV